MDFTNLEFVPVGDPKSRSKARAHVMRDYHRQRRLRDMQKFQTQQKSPQHNVDKRQISGISVSYTSPRLGHAILGAARPSSAAPGPDAAQTQSASAAANGETSRSGRHSRRELTKTWEDETQEHDKGQVASSENSTLITVLSEAKKDPFQTFPIPVTKDDIKLINHRKTITQF